MTAGAGNLPDRQDALAILFGGARQVLFVLYAGSDPDGYTEAMREVLASLGVRVSGAHRAADPLAALGRADAVFVGGSDSFRLLRAVQRNGMLVAIGDRGRAEMPYVGVSAGANLACPTIRTTNDIPIAQPASLTALGLIPFQLNPHYPAVGMDGGQTRQARDRRLDGVPEHGSGLRHHRGCPGFVHAPSLADHWLERVSSGRR